jgi:hypothetical protein
VSVYNNVIWDVSGYGIYVDNLSTTPDTYTRFIYFNTIDSSTTNAVYHVGGTQDVRNNIGPSTAGNIPCSSSYFVSTAEGSEDYHLIGGAAPINAGTQIAGIGTDRDGSSRDSTPDIGAYEFGTAPLPGETAPAAIIVYPNPVNFSKSLNSTVKFDNLYPNSDMFVYNTSGDLIRKIFVYGNTAGWDGKNEGSEFVARGAYYIVAVNQTDGAKRRGKLFVIK